MRNKGIWRKGLGVGECEVARIYTYTPLSYKYKYMHTHKIPLHKYIQIYHAYIYTPLYTYLLQIYYTNTMQNYHAKHTHLQIPLQIFFPSLHIYRASIYKPYPTYTYTFVVFYTYLQVVPGCFSLFRFSLNKGYFYSMTYSFPIFLHRFPYFLANLLIFNCLCINDFFAILIGVFLIGRVILLFLSKSAAFAR